MGPFVSTGGATGRGCSGARLRGAPRRSAARHLVGIDLSPLDLPLWVVLAADTIGIEGVPHIDHKIHVLGVGAPEHQTVRDKTRTAESGCAPAGQIYCSLPPKSEMVSQLDSCSKPKVSQLTSPTLILPHHGSCHFYLLVGGVILLLSPAISTSRRR